MSMQNLNTGDLVMVINALCHPELIGHAGTVVHGEGQVSGTDRFGRVVSGRFVIVELPHDLNRHGTTLWYFKASHLLRIGPGAPLPGSERETRLTETAI